MNQGEIEALSCRELQAKAAELMGWQCFGEENWRTPEGVSTRAVTWKNPRGYTSYGLAPPKYTNDIAAAASLWDYYSKGRECYFGLSYDLGRDEINPWSCAMRPEAMGIDFVYGDGPTEAIARTRAFILAMESENAN